MKLSLAPRIAARRWFPVLAVFAATALGCAGGDQAPTDDNDNAAITSDEANARSGNLQERILTSEPASADAKRELGIVKWDAFAGTDEKSGFRGAVYYASDADGDVRYAYSVDVPTKQVALVMLAKNGEKITNAKIEPAQYTRLMSEVALLKESIEKRPSRAVSCAITIGVAAALVVAASAAVIATPLELGVAAYYGVLAGHAVVGEASTLAMIGLGWLVTAGVGGALAAGFGYVTYKVASVASAVVDNAVTCASGKP